MQTIIAIVIGYLIAAGIYDDVALNLPDTNWQSGFTYLKILSGWMLAVLGLVAVWAAIAFATLMAKVSK